VKPLARSTELEPSLLCAPILSGSILIVITRFLTKGSIKVYNSNRFRHEKELTRRSLV